LNIDTSGKEKTFSVLVLVDETRKPSTSGSRDKKLFDYLSLAAKGVGLENVISANHQVSMLLNFFIILQSLPKCITFQRAHI
jgi:hypothetical protein